MFSRVKRSMSLRQALQLQEAAKEIVLQHWHDKTYLPNEEDIESIKQMDKASISYNQLIDYLAYDFSMRRLGKMRVCYGSTSEIPHHAEQDVLCLLGSKSGNINYG